MLNHHSSNYNHNIENKKSYNQISIEKITNMVNQPKQRAYSINNIEKAKQKGKVTPSKLKTISVNKQIQNKNKSNINNNENTFFNSYNGISLLKSKYNNYNNNKIKKNNFNMYNINNNTNPKNNNRTHWKKGVNNYSNNKLKRKMILSVDINNKKSIKNISQYDINNSIKLLTDNEKIQSNNTNSNPLSNGAKNSGNSNNKNKSNNNLMKSPEKIYNVNNFTKYIEISGDNKNIKNNTNNYIINKKLNIQTRQPLKLFEQNSSANLTSLNSGNYKVNYTNVNVNSNNDKKIIKPNLKNTNSNNYYKINHNNNKNYNKYNIYDKNNNNINEKIIKEIFNIETDLEKNLKNNITNSKSKKYNIIKHSFELLLKLLGNSILKNNNVCIGVLLEKILIGYHEVFNAFSTENRKLKQINYNLNEQYEKISKDLFNNNKLIKEKQNLIDNLQKKINFLESGIKKKNLSNNFNNNINIIPNEDNFKEDQNKKIFELNKQNLQDLDALYFYDKVKVENDNKNNNKKGNKDKYKKPVSIPKILIHKLEEQIENEEEEEEYEVEENNRTVIFSNVCGLFISSGDIKFSSQIFINLRKEFIL